MANPNYYLLGPIEGDNITEFMVTYNTVANGNNMAYFLTIIPGSDSDSDTLLFDPRTKLASGNGSADPCELSPTEKASIALIIKGKCQQKFNCDKKGINKGIKWITGCKKKLKKCEDPKTIAADIQKIQQEIFNNPVFNCLAPGTSNRIPIGTLLTLKASPVSGGWNFSFTLPGQQTRFLTVDSDNLLTTGTSPETFTIVQNTITPWPGVPFLAGVNYGFQVNGQNVKVNTYIGGKSKKDDTIIATLSNSETTASPQISIYNGTVRVLPTKTYFNGTVGGNTGCHASGQTDSISTATVRNIEATWAATGIGPPSYTSVADCQVNVRYNYCTNGDLCGTGNCRGPCSSTDDNKSCQYNTSTNSYSCRKVKSNTPFYLRPWFIIIMVLFGILFFGLIILLIVRFDGPKAKSHDDIASVTKFSDK
jgi:hypothetical protein